MRVDGDLIDIATRPFILDIISETCLTLGYEGESLLGWGWDPYER